MDTLKGFKTVAGLAIFMVALQLLNVATGYSLNAFGLVPRTLHGLVAIITSPFLHTSSAKKLREKSHGFADNQAGISWGYLGDLSAGLRSTASAGP